MVDPVTAASVKWGITVVGWIISPIISKLLKRCFSYLGFRSSHKLKKLEIKILELKLMLESAESNPQRGRLEKWIEKLKSSFYEAEDILDSIDYYMLERSIIPYDKSASSCFGCNMKQTFSGPMEGRNKLKVTVYKMEKLIDDGHKLLSLLKLPVICDNINNRPNNTVRPPTRSTSTPPVVFGRHGDLEMIRQMLRDTPTDDEPSSTRTKCYSVIGIHGIPGSGKTTLAQYVCEHEREGDYFELIMWIHVSQNFSVDIVFTEMLEIASDGKTDTPSNLDMLQRKLESKLRGKRFFLVLDDVWHDKDIDDQQLDLLLSPLKAGKRGSKILVTTRTANAARALGAQDLVAISDLDKEQFFSMFMYYALDGETISDQSLLREHECIARIIAGKLGQSPLAARLVAGQLRRRLDIEFWRRAVNRDLLNDTMGAIWWSYQQLEDSVKQCFTYCSMFPRRYELQRDELVQLWVAEGFVETTNNSIEDIEDIAHDCFDVLLSCSFIQPRGKGGVSNFFTVHDLLHDLAGRAAGNDCFRIGKGTVGQIPLDVRHLFIESYDRNVFTEQIRKLGALRTLVMSSSANEMTVQDFEQMLLSLKKLRVAHVRVQGLNEIPACIGELKHLRYLGLFGSPSDDITLPPTFAKLYHLQKLSTPPVTNLQCASTKEMASLVNLRDMLTFHSLGIPDIGRMLWLRTLFIFTVKKARGYELRQLENLDNLRGTLHIQGLENVKSKEEARQAKLVNKVHLSDLIIRWSTTEKMLENLDGEMLFQEAETSRYMDPRLQLAFSGSTRQFNMLELEEERTCEQRPDPQDEVLEALCPPSLIKSLVIKGYRGSTYPSWLSGRQGKLENLQRLELYRCRGTEAPPNIGETFNYLRVLVIAGCSWNSLPENMELLTSLEELTISECTKILTLARLPKSLKQLTLNNWYRSYDPPPISNFPVNLRILKISDCCWHSLPEDMECLTSLEELTIQGCEMLWSLPRLPPSLKRLTLKWCKRLRDSRRLNIAHIPEKIIVW